MMPIKDNEDVACFYVTKHSWKGKYKRIFSIGTLGITTYNPTNLEVTNRWIYNDIIKIEPITTSTSGSNVTNSSNITNTSSTSTSTTGISGNNITTNINTGNTNSNANNNEFILTMRKDKKVDTMRFSCDYRTELLTDTLKALSINKSIQTNKYNGYKLHWSQTKLPCMFEITSYSLNQLDPTSNVVLTSYYYKDLEGIAFISDVDNGFVIVYGGYGRLHLFISANRQDIINKMIEQSQQHLGIQIKILKNYSITLEECQIQRFGKYSTPSSNGSDDLILLNLQSINEFIIYKVNKERHQEPVKRILCLTETCLIERDIQTYSICTLQPYTYIYALIRDINNPQLFYIEYITGIKRVYTCSVDRDTLLATLLDSIRSSGNYNIHIKSYLTVRGKRYIPFKYQLDDDIELLHIKYLIQSGLSLTNNETNNTNKFNNINTTYTFYDILERFNTNIPYTGLLYTYIHNEGLFSENKDKLLTNVLLLLANNNNNEQLTIQQLELQFHALRRLCATKIGFQSFTHLNGFRESIGNKIIFSLRKQDPSVTYASIDMLCALMHYSSINSIDEQHDLRQEQLNKSSLLHSNKFLDQLLNMWIDHINYNTGALIINAMLDFLTYALCVPYCETTDSKHFDNLLEMVAARGRSLFKLFQHPSMAIIKGAGLIMRAIIEEGDDEIALRMQHLALAEGILPRHLLTALYTSAPTQTTDNTTYCTTRLLTHRQLSRHLIGLWVTGNPIAMGVLKRILPIGLLHYLDSNEQVKNDNSDDKLLNVRDNLKLAQDDFKMKQKSQQWLTIERQIKNVEKHLEHYTELAVQHWSNLRATSGTTTPTNININKLKQQQLQQLKDKPIVLRKRRQHIKSESNWRLFYLKFNENIELPNLIWNHKTREELKLALEYEIRSYQLDKDLSNGILIAWNYQEFEVHYQCLSDEIKIGDYYLRVLLEQSDTNRINLLNIRKSYEFFNDLYHRFLLTNKLELKCYCLHAMTIVYNEYYEDIGPFNDIKYMILMLEKCTDHVERDRLIMFIQKLILNKKNVHALIHTTNMCRILLELSLLSHLSFNLNKNNNFMKLNKDDDEFGNQSATTIEANDALLNDNNPLNKIKEWYYTNTNNKERDGPCTFNKLKQLFQSNVITTRTKCWAQGMDSWKLFYQIPQLKWYIMYNITNNTGTSTLLNDIDLTILILNIFIKMCEYYPSRDSDNAIIRPLPKIKRILSDQQCLSHIVQLLLTFDPVIVEKVSTLLYLIMYDNPDISKIYLTGVFYFILMYTGSNIKPIATFLKLTHLKQAFNTTTATDSDSNSSTSISDIVQRSILGQLLPEAMINYLENHGPDKFSQIFLGEYDTPESIWNSDMRRLLINKIAGHISEFTERLHCNIQIRYQYIPIPAIRYPQLENELFCNIYYLKHLCDTNKYLNWPIKQPIKLLIDVLDLWRSEVDKKPSTINVIDAYKILQLDDHIDLETNKIKTQITDDIVRKAYYKLAQKYHPDKNPQGREQFEQIRQAYEYLCSRKVWYDIQNNQSNKNNNNININNIILILKTQIILYKRYYNDLKEYKYAGYDQLIKTIKYETNNNELFNLDSQQSQQLLINAIELCYSTVKYSKLNIEELHRNQHGLDILLLTFNRSISIITKSSKPTDLNIQILKYTCKCFYIASQFTLCRDHFITKQQFIYDICFLLNFKHLNKLCINVIKCICALSYDSILQMQLLKSGVLWYLLQYIFIYDYTLDQQSETTTSDQDNTNKDDKNNEHNTKDDDEHKINELEQQNKNDMSEQQLNNLLSKYSIIALIKLGGFMSNDTPNNNVIQTILQSLLTTYICEQFKLISKDDLLIDNQLLINQNQSINKILKLLNTSCETPYFIWNHLTRTELNEFILDKKLNSRANNSEQLNITDELIKSSVDFKYKTLSDELVISNIYIRVYNQQSTTTIIQQSQQFVTDLLKYIHDEHKYIIEQLPNITLSVTMDGKINNIIECLLSLKSVLLNNNDTKLELTVCNNQQNVTLLFNILYHINNDVMKKLTLDIVNIITRSQECVQIISQNKDHIYTYLLLLLYQQCDQQLYILQIVYLLISNTRSIQEFLNKGILLYLLDLYCNSTILDIREQCGIIIARMINDKLIGPRIKLIINKFIPLIFIDALLDNNVKESITMFDSEHEHPELIWNHNYKSNIQSIINKLRKEFQQLQINNLQQQWIQPDNKTPLYLCGMNNGGDGANEQFNSDQLIISGVYLNIFIKNPSWTLRKPKEFLSELMDAYIQNITKDVLNIDHINLITQSICSLLQAQPTLCDNIPSFGHLQRLLQLITTVKTNTTEYKLLIYKSFILILHQITLNELCVTTLSKVDNCMLIIKQIMQLNSELVGIGCETLNRIFTNNNTINEHALIKQLLSIDMISYLLKLLSINTIDNTTKAYIVKIIKIIEVNSLYGQRIQTTFLNSNTVWSQYKEQKHDLFISNNCSNNTYNYLTGNTTPANAGYLTQGTDTTQSLSTVPPPLEDDDDNDTINTSKNDFI